MKIVSNDTMKNDNESLSNVIIDTFKNNSSANVLTLMSVNAHKCCSRFSYDIDSKKVSFSEYQTILSKNRIYGLYEKFWEVKGAVLPQIYLCETASCHKDFLGFQSYEDKIKLQNDSRSYTSFTSWFSYIVPHKLPYMMHYSNKSGLICTTPFFSIICANIKQIPEDLFVLSTLTLNSVITNSIFRHELVFNPDLYIKEPLFICESPQLEILWMQIDKEVEDIQRNPLTYAPLIFLPQMLKGLKTLTLSLLPEHLSSEVDHYMDTKYLLCGDEATIMDFFCELAHFVSTVVETCAISSRKMHVDQMKVHLLKSTKQPHQLIKGIALAIDLLNSTKVDQINLKLKQQASSLYLSSTAIEKSYFLEQVDRGVVDMVQACAWLNSQPVVNSVRNFKVERSVSDRSVSNIVNESSPFLNEEIGDLSKLVYGFINDFIGPGKLSPNLNLFPLDESRIIALKRHLNRLILKRLAFEAKRLYPYQSANDKLTFKRAMAVPNVYNTKFYQLIEQRARSELIEEVFSNLSLLLGYRDPGIYVISNQRNYPVPQIKQDEILVKEIVIVLFLHWTSAHNFYCS